MFEQEILSQLKTKYANKGLSDTILKAKAKQLSKAVEKQEDIENAVAGVEADMDIFQILTDQNRTLANDFKKFREAGEGKTEEQKAAEAKAAKEKEEAEKKAGENNDVPEWAKAIIESNKTLTESLTAMKTKEAQQTNAQKLQTRLDDLKVSKTIQALIPAGLTFENDEAIEAYATEMKTKSDAIAQEFGNTALGNMAKPNLFGEVKKDGEVSPDVQAYVDSQKKQAKTNE